MPKRQRARPEPDPPRILHSVRDSLQRATAAAMSEGVLAEPTDRVTEA